MKKLRRTYPIAYDKENGYTYLTLSKQLITMDKNLDIIDKQTFLNDMYKGILVCDSKVLVTASPNGKIASYDLISKKIISRPKNIIKYGSGHKLFHNKEKNLIFRIGLGENIQKMLYSYKIEKDGILEVYDEACLSETCPQNEVVNYQISSVKNERVYMLECSERETDNVAFLFYDIYTKEKTYLWKENFKNHFYSIYDENHIINYEGTEIINVFNRKLIKTKIGMKSYRFFSEDRKYAVLWEHEARKLHIKNNVTYDTIKILDYEFFFDLYEIDDYVLIVSDGLDIYEKHEFYEK